MNKDFLFVIFIRIFDPSHTQAHTCLLVLNANIKSDRPKEKIEINSFSVTILVFKYVSIFNHKNLMKNNEQNI